MATVTEKPLSPAQRTLGAETFAAITAVEGLTPGAKARLDALKASGLSAEERRAEIRRVYAADDREG